MPTYDYECQKCGHTFEEYREITAAPRARCPRCRGRVQRLVSGGAGIVFKGSGWYVKDSRRPAAAASGTAKGTAEAAESSPPPSADTAAQSAASTGAESDRPRRRSGPHSSGKA